MSENIIESTLDEAKKRLFESHFWSSFVISWLIINWKIVYVTLSWSSIAIDDKIKYIEGLHQGVFITILITIIYPLWASFIAVAVIPFINHVYLWIRKFHRDRDANIEIREIQKEKEIIKEKQDLKKEEKKLEKSEQEIWNEEYDKLIKKFPDFWKPLTNLIYDYEWYSKQSWAGGNRIFDAGEIQLLDINGLILPKEKNTAYFSITDKWKYFLKKQSLS